MFELQSVGPGLNWIILPILVIVPVALIFVLLTLAGLPGKIAATRGHRQATAVRVCGWLGLLTGVSWPIALIWAYMDPPDSDAQSEKVSQDDALQIANALRQASERLSKIERLIAEKAPHLESNR
jgi:hypothetical protein